MATEMTRDEQRAALIEAMDRAFMSVAWRNIAPDVFERRRIKEGIAAAFDAQHGLARVNSIEATEEMIRAVGDVLEEADVWRAMSAAGDLTNRPEGKP